MKSFVRSAIVVVACTLLGSTAAYAQATRTWVSGVGDDVNPCSRTAPCKTFAGAISKTAAGGEISVLDPGGFGAVTITKSITINGVGEDAGILAAAGPGIVINAGASDVIRLKHLHLLGVSNATVGIRFINGAALIVDDVAIINFQTGIESNVGTTFVNDLLVTQSTYYALRARGTSTFTIENSMITNNNIGAMAEDSSQLRMSNNAFYNNLTGFSCLGSGVLASAGNNRKAGNSGGSAPVCSPTVAITVQ